MQLVGVNFEHGTADFRLESRDCELLAQVINAATDAATGADPPQDIEVQNLALLFTLSAVACRIYGVTNSSERAHEILQRCITRCAAEIGLDELTDRRLRKEGGQ